MNLIPIIGNLLYETASAMILKIAWGTITERFFTRLALFCLEKLKKRWTNQVTQKTIDDFIQNLKGKRLKIIDDIE